MNRRHLLPIVDHFLDQGWRGISESAATSKGKCKWVSLALLKHLEDRGIVADLFCLSNDLDPGAPTDFHFVVRVEDLAVDTTARQYDQTADVPLIRDFGIAFQEFDSADPVDPDDAWQRKLHKIPADWKSISPTSLDDFMRRQTEVRDRSASRL